jgi:hypothetical protein
MDTKICKICKNELPLESFGKNGKAKDGHIRRKAKCLKCLQEWERSKFQERIFKIVGGRDKVKCQSCGYDKCIAAIDFHHINPSTKDHLVSGMKNYSEKKLRSEIEKCMMLCCMCHREVHAGMRSLPNHETSQNNQCGTPRNSN